MPAETMELRHTASIRHVSIVWIKSVEHIFDSPLGVALYAGRVSWSLAKNVNEGPKAGRTSTIAIATHTIYPISRFPQHRMDHLSYVSSALNKNVDFWLEIVVSRSSLSLLRSPEGVYDRED